MASLKFSHVLFSLFFSAGIVQSRIIGGMPAGEKQFPYAARIQSRSFETAFCGGTIIDYRHIMTSSNCIITVEWAGTESGIFAVLG